MFKISMTKSAVNTTAMKMKSKPTNTSEAQGLTSLVKIIKRRNALFFSALAPVKRKKKNGKQ